MLLPALPVPQNRTFIRTLHGSSKPQRADGLFCVPGIKKLVASDMTLATSWKGRLKSIFEMRVMGRTRKRKSPNRSSGRRRQCAVRAFCRRQNLGAGGIHFRRAFESPQGGAALWAAEPTKKDTTYVVSSACRKRSPFGGLFLVLREKMR